MAHVVVTNSIPLKEISFSAPVPDCLGGPGAYIFGTSPYAMTGDSQSGITIDLGGCVTSPVTVLTIYFNGVSNEPPGCCFWPVISVDGWEYSSFDFVDCNDVVRHGYSAVGARIYACCEEWDVLSPYEPYPPNHATGVPTDVTFTWLLPDPRCEEWIWVQTLPDPPPTPIPGTTDYFTSYQPSQPLEPNTTYYWMVGLQCTYDESARSDFWSFTTGDGPAVATEQSTWGRIKSTYER